MPGVDGAVERGRSGAGVAGVILIRFPSNRWGVCAVDGEAGRESLDAFWRIGDREGEEIAEFGGESDEPSPDEAGTGFESLASRLLRI